MRCYKSSIHKPRQHELLAPPALALGAALALAAALLGPTHTAQALEWKTPGAAKPAASVADAVSIESVSTEVVPLPAPTPAPPKHKSPKVTKASAESRPTNPDVGLSERLELSNGAELVWVTDESAAEREIAEQKIAEKEIAARKNTAKKKSEQKQPAQRTAQKTSPARMAAKKTSLDTASALNSKALAATTKKAQAETAAGDSSPANASNSCSPRANSCCATSAGNSCGDCASGCCGNGCGRMHCRGCGRIGCLGCGLCHKGEYMDRFANCNCDGSYKFPVPPLYTYHWPGMYSHQLMTDYHSPWRYPPLRPYTDEPSDDQLAPVE